MDANIFFSENKSKLIHYRSLPLSDRKLFMKQSMNIFGEKNNPADKCWI